MQYIKLIISFAFGLALGIVGLVLGQQIYVNHLEHIYAILLGVLITICIIGFGYFLYKNYGKDLITENQVVQKVQDVSEGVLNHLDVNKEQKEKVVDSSKTIAKYYFKISSVMFVLKVISALLVGLGGIIGSVLILNQNELLKNQNKIIETQITLEEANRRSSLQFMLSGIMDKIYDELRDTTNTERKLSPELQSRIISFTHSLKPYKYLENDVLIDKPVSPERSQLVYSLIELQIHNNNLKNIFSRGEFSFIDLSKHKLIRKHLTFLRVNNTIFRDTELYDFYFQNLAFKTSFFDNANLRNSIFRNTSFYKCILKNVNLSNSDLRGLSISNSVLFGTNFSFSKVASPNWFNELKGINLNDRNYLHKNFVINDTIMIDKNNDYYFIILPKNTFNSTECTSCNYSIIYKDDKIDTLNSPYHYKDDPFINPIYVNKKFEKLVDKSPYSFFEMDSINSIKLVKDEWSWHSIIFNEKFTEEKEKKLDKIINKSFNSNINLSNDYQTKTYKLKFNLEDGNYIIRYNFPFTIENDIIKIYEDLTKINASCENCYFDSQNLFFINNENFAYVIKQNGLSDYKTFFKKTYKY